MYCEYKTKKGEILEAFVWDDLLDMDYNWLRTNFDVRNKTKDTKEHHRDVFIDDDGKYFMYENEKIYFKNFLYKEYEEICDLLNAGENVKHDDILTSFIKFPDKVIAACNLSVFDAVIPIMGIGICGSESMLVPCKPIKDGRYPVKDWGHKISFTPILDKLKVSCATETYYFSDFVSLLKRTNCIKLFKTEDECVSYVKNHNC